MTMLNSYDLLLSTSEKRVFLDSETCGLHGMMVLFQYQVEDNDIVLYDIWNEPVWKTMQLFEALMKHVVIGFNLVFDFFHIVKIYTIWGLLPQDWVPKDHIEEIAEIEPQGQDGPCLKPFGCLDLMLHSRKGPYQSLMARSDIYIRRIPRVRVEWEDRMTTLPYAVANYLSQNVQLDGIYFSRSRNEDAGYWTVVDREDTPGFQDVVLRFSASGALKSLAEHALGMKPEFKFADIELDKNLRPIEYGFAPTAKSVSSAERDWEFWGKSHTGNMVLKGHAWPGVIARHIDHWENNEPAREYARYDVVYTRELYFHFDAPEHSDNDSILSCMVPAIRWRGFSIDIPGVENLLEQAQSVVTKAPINTNRPIEIRNYIYGMLNIEEQLTLDNTTRKERLEEISHWIIGQDEPCSKCEETGLNIETMESCLRCEGGTVLKGPHPASARAKEVLDIKIAKKEIELYEKLLIASKFHASFKITGTLSNRMAGGDGLNAQGIKSDPKVRSRFPLVWEGYNLCGGDFDSFEVTIADAVYADDDLRKCLLEGKKIHGLFGMALFPGYAYEQILDSKDNPGDYEFGDMYSISKSGVFALLFSGNASTLNRNLGIPMEIAEAAFKKWGEMFPGIERARQRVIDSFQPLKQPGGIGTAISWVEPQEYVETVLGFRRYFTLEYKIAKSLFNLARQMPQSWRQCEETVLRSERKGVQKAWGALSSALYGAAFGICDANVRAAANHEIQSVGAEITKATQCSVWELQPVGVSSFVVGTLNIHDEVITVTKPEYVEAVAEKVQTTVESYRDRVPLIGMGWCKSMDNWAEKKHGGDMLQITYDTAAMLEELNAT